MARRNPNVTAKIDLEADASSARKAIAKDLGRIEEDAKDTAKAVERAFENVSPELAVELDTAEIRQALDLAGKLDGMVAEFTVDTDLEEIKQAEAIARSLRSFQGRVDLSVEGRAELADALALAEKMDQIRKVKVDVQGREDLEKAARLADDLEQRRTVRVDVDDSGIKKAGDRIASELESGGERGAEGIADAINDVDFGDLGGSARDQFIGQLAAAGPWAAAAAGIASVVGDEFMGGFSDALPAARTDAIRALRTGLTGPELEEVGRVAADLYATGIANGLSKNELRDAVATVKGELRDLDDVELKQVTSEALLLSEAIGIDLTEAISTAEKLANRGLVSSVSEGLNLLLELAQKTGIEFGEMLELVDEFGGDIKALGIDSAQGWAMMTEIFDRGLTEQLDQAGEIFSELNENITNGGAAEALDLIGLNAEEMTRRVVSGGPDAAAAISDIAEAVLAVPDPTDRANAAIAIFGGNVGLMGTEARDAVLEIFTLADGSKEVGTQLSDSVKPIEDTATGLDRLKRFAADAGNELGTSLADGVDTLDKLSRIRFDSTAAEWESLGESAAGFGEALATKLIGPLGELHNRGPEYLDPFGPLVHSFEELTGGAEELAPKLATVVEKGGHAGRTFDELGTDAADAADRIDETKAATDLLNDALQAFSGRFAEDQIFRRIEEDAAAALEATKGLEAGTYTMATGFDISTEAGRRAQAALEDLSLDADDMSQAYLDGRASADDLAGAQNRVEDTLRQVAGQMGLNQSETDALIAKYGSVQSEIFTRALFESENALAAVLEYQRQIGAIPSYKQTTVATHFVSTGTKVYQTGGGFAEGGAVEGGVPIVVGEKGDELFVPDQDGTIIPHDETERLRRMASGNPRAQALVGAGAGGGGGQAVAKVIIGSDGSAFGRMVVQAMRKETKNRGGVDVVFDY